MNGVKTVACQLCDFVGIQARGVDHTGGFNDPFVGDHAAYPGTISDKAQHLCIQHKLCPVVNGVFHESFNHLVGLNIGCRWGPQCLYHIMVDCWVNGSGLIAA